MHETRPTTPTALPVAALVKNERSPGLAPLSASAVAAKPPAWHTTAAGTRTTATNISVPWMKSVQHTAM